jgi:hypothetical protein
MTTFLRISDDPEATSAEIEKERQTVDIDSPTRREDGAYSPIGENLPRNVIQISPMGDKGS